MDNGDLKQLQKRANEFLQFATQATQAKSQLLQKYSKTCVAVNTLEKAIAERKQELEETLEELQQSIEKASEDGLSKQEEESWNNVVRDLQRERSELTQGIRAMEGEKEKAEQEKERLRERAGNLKMQCYQRLNQIEQFSSDCRVTISKLQKSAGVSGQVGTIRFGSSGRQLESDISDQIRSCYGFMSNAVAAKWKIQGVLQSSSSENHEPDVPERDIAEELER